MCLHTSQSHPEQHTQVHRICLVVLILVACVIAGSNCHAGLIGKLSALTDVGGNKLQSMFSLRVTNDFLPIDPDQLLNLDMIDLDIVHSQINGTPLLDFSAIQFEATNEFAQWQESVVFGVFGGVFVPSENSKMSLDAFSLAVSPKAIETNAFFEVGVFTIDYGSLGLGTGDTITLDVTGVPDTQGSATSSGVLTTINRTTGLSVPPIIAESKPFEFPTTAEPGVQTFTINNTGGPVIPEPSSSLIFCAMAGIGIIRTRRRN